MSTLRNLFLALAATLSFGAACSAADDVVLLKGDATSGIGDFINETQRRLQGALGRVLVQHLLSRVDLERAALGAVVFQAGVGANRVHDLERVMGKPEVHADGLSVPFDGAVTDEVDAPAPHGGQSP